MNTGSIIKYGLIAAVIGWVYFSDSGSSEDSYVEEKIDLNLVLDVTVETLHTVSETIDENAEPDAGFFALTDALIVDYNKSVPAIYDGTIGVIPQQDASLLAFDDVNGNGEHEESEPLLFLIEIDGEKARIIASSSSGAINDHYFSGTSLLTGYLIGSMLSRQLGAGVNPKSLSNKKPITSRAAAKARAGSGSHSKGK